MGAGLRLAGYEPNLSPYGYTRMKITRKGYYTIQCPSGELLTRPDGAIRQATTRDDCYEYITEDTEQYTDSGTYIYRIIPPEYEVATDLRFIIPTAGTPTFVSESNIVVQPGIGALALAGIAVQVNPTEPNWTVLTPSSDSRIIYVDESGGDDGTGVNYIYGVDGAGVPGSNDWENPVGENAYQTIAQGYIQLRNGYPDYLLLKKGETWYESLGQYTIKGRSPSEPMVTTAYGSGARPLLKTGTSSGLTIALGAGGESSMDNLIFKGIHFYANARDPDSGEFSFTGDSQGIALLNRGMVDTIFEDNVFAFYRNGIGFIAGSGTGVNNVTFRYNIIADSYGVGANSQGIYMKECDGVLFEYNTLDHNGWHETVSGAGMTQFNHATYFQTDCTNVDSNYNIVMRGDGAGLRCGGIQDGNFTVECVIGLLMGGADSGRTANSMSDNVVLNGNDFLLPLQERGYGLSYGVTIQASNNLVSNNNIIASEHSLNPNPEPYFGSGQAYTSFSGNIVHDWGAGNDTGVPGQYVDPDRTIEGYNTSAGGLGTRADFFAQVLAQSQDTWNPDYSVEAIKQYFIEGYTDL